MLALLCSAANAEAESGPPASSNPEQLTEHKLSVRELVDAAVLLLDSLEARDAASMSLPSEIELPEFLPLELSEAELDNMLESLQGLLVEQPAQAIEMALELAPSEYALYRVVLPLLQSWARDHPEQAYHWAQQQSAELRVLAIREVAATWSQINAGEFLLFTETQPAEALDLLFDEALYHVAHALTDEDPLAALDWAAALPLRYSSAGKLAVFDAWYSQTPDDALANSKRWLTHTEEFEFLISVAHELPQQNLEFALTLFAQTDPELRAFLAYPIAHGLFGRNPLQALQWVGDLPAGPAHTEAFLAVVYLQAAEHPDQAWLFLSQYRGDDRQSVLEQGLWSIAAHNPEAIRALPELNTLTDQERELINSLIRDLSDPEWAVGC